MEYALIRYRRLRCYFILLLLCSSLPLSAFAQWYEQSREMMGTRIHIELWSENAADAEQTMMLGMDEIERIDKLMNPLNEHSELYRINQLATDKPIKISKELYWIINKSLYFSQISHGAFDISFSSAGRYYDYRAGLAPSPEQLEKLKGSINYHAIKLDQANSTVFLAQSGMHLDLGGIAKGYAVDRAVSLLEKRAVSSAIVTAGGDSRIIGGRGDRPWYIGIKHPRKDQGHAVMLPLVDTAISTSGDYERYFIEDGVRYHHILSPKTAASVSHVQSVSVLATKAVDSDALSTTVFILGVEKGLALVNGLDGIDAIIIDAEGKLHYSADLLLSQ